MIEATPLSLDTSRKVTLHLSKIQMIVSAGKVAEDYVPALLYGIIGIFHKRFSYLWNPAMDCLAVLISQHFEIVWEKYVGCLDYSESKFLISKDESSRSGAELLNKPNGKCKIFFSFFYKKQSYITFPKNLNISLVLFHKFAMPASQILDMIFLTYIFFNRNSSFFLRI